MVYRIGIDCLQLFQLPRVPGLKTLESFENWQIESFKAWICGPQFKSNLFNSGLVVTTRYEF
jgi:hypothetical protein